MVMDPAMDGGARRGTGRLPTTGDITRLEGIIPGIAPLQDIVPLQGIPRGTGRPPRPVRRRPPTPGRVRRRGTISTRALGTSTAFPIVPVPRRGRQARPADRRRPGPQARPADHRRPGPQARPADRRRPVRRAPTDVRHRPVRRARPDARLRPDPSPGKTTSTPTRAVTCTAIPRRGGSRGDGAVGAGTGDPVRSRTQRHP